MNSTIIYHSSGRLPAVTFVHGRKAKRYPIDAIGLVGFRIKGKVVHEPPEPEVNAALRFLEAEGIAGHLQGFSGPVVKVSSYELKHLIEKCVRRYLSNGSVIVATLLADCEQTERGTVCTRISLPADFVRELRAKHGW